jgi:hypothetical protein
MDFLCPVRVLDVLYPGRSVTGRYVTGRFVGVPVHSCIHSLGNFLGGRDG